MAEFLFEIGLEEIPARMIAGAQEELQRRIVGMLKRERLVGTDVEAKSFATPRRLAVWVKGVADKQEDLAEELMGPAAKIAFKDGAATAAAVAFAKKAGVEVESLKTVLTPKGEYVTATSVKTGCPAADVIAWELPKELAGIYWAKNMYWRPGKPERFVRPVRWMLALLDGAVVPVEFAGKTAGAVTYGHRVLSGDGEIQVAAPSEYEGALLKGYVISDVEIRRQRIRKALDKVTRGVVGARWREDEGLVDKLTHLTEWPTVLMGGFEPEFLVLPEEVLVTVMRDHQGYFAVEDTSGKLAPHFLTVLNIEADEKGLNVIRHGNESVLRARFNDARFFWEFDQRVPLVERVADLHRLTFHKDLGSYFQKANRIAGICSDLAKLISEKGTDIDQVALMDAVTLAKADLTTELVKEFTELQGMVGGLYAQAQGLGEVTATAIYDHYLPKSMEDKVPRTVEGGLLAIADKADSIAGMFGLGLEPTGSKDPFALRRAANGVVKILAESAVPLPMTLGDVTDAATKDEKVRLQMEIFFAERLEFYLREAKEQAYDVVKAVLAAGANDVRDAVARAEALTEVRGSEDFAAVSAAFKRMKNILAQAEEKGLLKDEVVKSGHVTLHPVQAALSDAAAKVGEEYSKLAGQHEYGAALERMATLRPQVDEFFNQVMVMDDNVYVRYSRLSLLKEIVGTFSKVADFSEIVTTG